MAKDSNVYNVILEFDAKTENLKVALAKNKVQVNLDELPQHEQKMFVGITAQGYVSLDEKVNILNNN